MKEFVTRMVAGIVGCGGGSVLVLDGTVRWYKTVMNMNDEEKKKEKLKNYSDVALSMFELGVGICDVAVGAKVLTKLYD